MCQFLDHSMPTSQLEGLHVKSIGRTCCEVDMAPSFRNSFCLMLGASSLTLSSRSSLNLCWKALIKRDVL